MSSSHEHDRNPDHSDDEVLAQDEVEEEINIDDTDVAMDSDADDDDELLLQNDSIAYFDKHKDSVFAIAQHPIYPSLIATGGSEGDEDDAPGKGYVIDTSAAPPVLPASYNADPNDPNAGERPGLDPLFEIDGHTDSISALAFTLPKGEVLVSGGMDGKLRAYGLDVAPGRPCKFTFLGEAQEVPEVNWIVPCPSPEYPNTIAIGAVDGSVWVYTIDPSDSSNPLQITQSYFLHTGSCTAGAWTPDGSLLVTISEDITLYVWDVWGLAAAKGLGSDNGTAVSLTGADQRFAVEGGFYSIAIEPKGTFAAVGGVGGAIRIISLPRLSAQPQASGRGGKAKGAAAEATAGGQILASLVAQSDTIETLSFSTTSSGPGASATAQTTLLAAGSVDGSIAVFDASRRFAVRRHIQQAHGEHAVVKVEFIKGQWQLTSCGMDGVVKRWDLRAGGATAGSDSGLVKEWKGHRGDGEGGGVLGFVQGETGERIVTAGDDSVVLVFEA
ncbi:hypothetical protein jhhlp_004214 [Lomentospora prolificans]|uniref:Uncharacterized protein n=1 Tax=Lomentospora prolificans TaxID=41688 RepID=A0A2N3NAX2_9PEZI|nr:hypothetical protein jhhlp_004214 [Lomentospora prolificans]